MRSLLSRGDKQAIAEYFRSEPAETSPEFAQPQHRRRTTTRSQVLLVRSVPIVPKALAILVPRPFRVATAPRPMRAATRANSMRSWPDSSWKNLDSRESVVACTCIPCGVGGTPAVLSAGVLRRYVTSFCRAITLFGDRGFARSRRESCGLVCS